MNNYSKQKIEINLLCKSYITSKRRIKEHEENIVKCSVDNLRAYRRIVKHIEDVVSNMEENEKMIIEKEVLEGKRGKWYLEFFTTSTYYRHRKKAYTNFLRYL